MDLSESPPALAFALGEEGRRLSLDPSLPRPEGAWAWWEALELDVPAGVLASGNGDSGTLKTRRLRLREAILATEPGRLQAGLRACVGSGSGFSDLRVWIAAGVPWIGGRVTIGNRGAPFTMRVALQARAGGARRLAVFLGDVRLYAPLPLPAPLVGSALARAIVAGCAVASPSRSPSLATREGGVDVDPLELALVPALVGSGWRMPLLDPAPLREVALPAESPGAEATLRLSYGGVVPIEHAPPACESWLEGERLPAALAGAERALFAGDVRAAEEAYRAHLAARPEELAAQARLVALAAPAGTAVLDAGARALVQAWPEFLPGWLYAALGAWQGGEREAAAACFLRASALAAARGEQEDARLAAEAAAAVRDGAPPEAASGAGTIVAGDDSGVPAAFVASVAHALMTGHRAWAEAAIDEHLRSHDDPARRGVLHAELAEALLAAGGGPALALATLTDVSLAGSSDHGLELRADLAERQGSRAEAARTLGELHTRALAAGDQARARVLADRQARMVAPAIATPVPRMIEANDSGDVTGRTAAVYATEKDTQARSGKLATLLRDFDRLPPERRRSAYASFGRVAESRGDLEQAEEAYRRAVAASVDGGGERVTDVAARPDQRAEFLIAHARLLVSRGNDRLAASELDEALRLAPDAASGLAARAELAFRAHDWRLARALYQKLDGAPGAADVLARETLVHRRAVLARDAGDDLVAEACFRELAILDPRQVEARQALAELAIRRGDRAAAVQRLEEVLRLLPLDAVDTALTVREQLGQLHTELEDWSAVRYYQELILAQEPGRVAALERLIDALCRLELFEEAAAACQRLSRLHPEPEKRAEALHRQGELLLERLHDEPRAFEAFLKASDLAPAFVPTAFRLVSGFWTRGRFGEVAEVASEVARTGALARAPLLIRLRAALAAAIAGHEPAPISATGIEDGREHPRLLAHALAEAAQHLGAATPATLEPAVKLMLGAGGSEARATLASVTAALSAMLADDPTVAGGGAALALGWLSDRRDEPATARPLYALAAFLNGASGVAARLDQLGPCPPASAASLALAGGNDHPGVGGTAAPLRRALGALAHGLAGFGPLATPPAPAGELALPDARRQAWHDLAKTMATPTLELAVAEARASESEDEDVTALATRPALVSIPRALTALPDDELTFLVTRAFDQLRAGLALVDAVTTREAREVEALLRGAAAALAGRAPPDLPQARAAAAELSSPDRLAALVGSAPKPRVAGDLLLAEEALVGWEGFRGAALLASDRFALLACRSPLAALRALFRGHQGDEPSEGERRAAFLRSPRARELVSFLISPAYADATRDAAP